MISAKREAFRLEIRQRQIQDKLRSKRRQFMLLQQRQVSKEQRQQFVTQAQNIIYNLVQLANGNDHYMYQGLLDLKSLLAKNPKQLPQICKSPYRIIESLSQILQKVTASPQQPHIKNQVFQLMVAIMGDLIQCDEITTLRILNSGFVHALLPYIVDGIDNEHVLAGLFGLLGNATRDSLQLANLYTEFEMTRLAINLVVNMNPKGKAVRQFLFFLRSYFDELRTLPKLNELQLKICKHFITQVTSQLLLQSIHEPNIAQQLEDALKALKHLIDYPEFDWQSLLLSPYISILQANAYPLEIKRQALYIIDSVICVCDDERIEELVVEQQLLQKIWSVDEEIKFIVFNIFANVTLNPELRTAVLPFVSRLRLEMSFYPESKFVFKCLLNYFTGRKFQVEGPIEEALVNELFNCQSRNPDVMEIEAKIWLGFVAYGYEQRPPERILEARHIKQVEQIWFCLQKGLHRRPPEDSSMQDSSTTEMM